MSYVHANVLWVTVLLVNSAVAWANVFSVKLSGRPKNLPTQA